VARLHDGFGALGKIGLMDVLERAELAIIDDDISSREAICGLMSAFGQKPVQFDSGARFLESASFDRFFCAIVDVHMPDMDGLEVQRHLATADPRIPVILMTAYPDDRTRALALDAGALGFLSKPCDHRQLIPLIDLASERSSAAAFS
jgi:FixJ family two-component response regulator